MLRIGPTPAQLEKMVGGLFPPPRPPDLLHVYYGIVASKSLRAVASVLTPFAFATIIVLFPACLLYSLGSSNTGTSWYPTGSFSLHGLMVSLLVSAALLVAVAGSILAQLNVRTGVSRTPVDLPTDFPRGAPDLYGAVQSSVLPLKQIVVHPAALQTFVYVIFILALRLLFLARSSFWRRSQEALLALSLTLVCFQLREVGPRLLDNVPDAWDAQMSRLEEVGIIHVLVSISASSGGYWLAQAIGAVLYPQRATKPRKRLPLGDANNDRTSCPLRVAVQRAWKIAVGRNETTEKDKTIQELSDAVKRSREDLAGATVTRDVLSRLLLDRSAEIQVLRWQLDASREAVSTMEAQHQDSLETLVPQLDASRSASKIHRAMISKLKGAVFQLDDEKDRLIKERDMVMQAREADIKKLQMEVSQLREKTAAFERDQTATLKTLMTRCKETMSQLTADTSAAEAEARRLRVVVNNQDIDIKQKTRSLEVCKNQLSDTESDLQFTRTMAEKEKGRLQSRIESLQRHVSSLDELKTLASDHSGARSPSRVGSAMALASQGLVSDTLLSLRKRILVANQDRVAEDLTSAMKTSLEEWQELLSDAGLIVQDRWEDAWEEEIALVPTELPAPAQQDISQLQGLNSKLHSHLSTVHRQLFYARAELRRARGENRTLSARYEDLEGRLQLSRAAHGMAIEDLRRLKPAEEKARRLSVAKGMLQAEKEAGDALLKLRDRQLETLVRDKRILVEQVEALHASIEFQHLEANFAKRSAESRLRDLMEEVDMGKALNAQLMGELKHSPQKPPQKSSRQTPRSERRLGVDVGNALDGHFIETLRRPPQTTPQKLPRQTPLRERRPERSYSAQKARSGPRRIRDENVDIFTPCPPSRSMPVEQISAARQAVAGIFAEANSALFDDQA